MLYKYGMRLRGFSIGCQPMNGFVGREDDPTNVYHDIIVYARLLTEKECEQYALDDINPTKGIKEMAKVLGNGCLWKGYDESKNCFDKNCPYFDKRNYVCCSEGMKEAEDLYTAGYRKAGEVVDEFVERLEKRFEQTETIANCLHGRTNTEIDRIIKIVAAEMRQEVEK